LLREDMKGEHQAIIQYLVHAYGLGEGGEACEIEGIARDEMRHLDWLADAITELGGDPTMERERPDVSGAPPAEQMRKDVDLEQMAIDQYREHMKVIEDPALRRLLARIVNDEIRHQGMFVALAEELGAEAAPPAEEGQAAPAQVHPRIGEILNEGIRHEYTVILQYLYHSFVAEGKELAEELQNAAINEMQHMGWFGEELAGSGEELPLTHHPLTLPADPEAMLAADVQLENETAAMYGQFIEQMVDPGAKGVIDDARGQELYHENLFGRLLKRLKPVKSPAAAPTTKVWTVGTLKRKS